LFISIFVFFSFIDVGWAFSERKELRLGRGQTKIRIVYGEKGRFFVDTYLIEADGWQERIDQKAFDDQRSAKGYFSRATKNYSDSSPENAITPRRNRAVTLVWDVTNQWNAEWEARFTEWVRQNLDENFYVKYQIPTDCADVAFSIRW